MKLQFCYEAANFQADAKKNPEQVEFKEKKRETMIELIDILDEGETAEEYLHTEEILRESMIMIEKNIFRTFQNKSKYYFFHFYINQIFLTNTYSFR